MSKLLTMTLHDQESDYNHSEEPEIGHRFGGVRRTRIRRMPSRQMSRDEGSDRDWGPASGTEMDCSLPALLRINSASLLRPTQRETEELGEFCDQFCGSIDMSDVVEETKECPRGSDDLNLESAVAQFEDRFEAADLFSQDKDGDTKLHCAIIILEEKLALSIIGKAASYTWLSLRNVLFQTPLHLGVLTRQARVVRALMAAGADISLRDKDGNTALHIACRDGLVDIVKVLLEPVRYEETLNNKYEIPYQAIPQDMSIANYEGLSCLHLAAMNRRTEIVELLETKDVDLNMKDLKTGRTILHYACLNGKVDLVRKLLKSRRCNINARAYDGSTPFDLARVKDDDIICMVLAAAGARYGHDDIDSD